jgi:sterol 3beta-glucosyltransferase
MSPDGASYGRALNALSWVVGRYVVRRSADPALNELFRQFGLRERRDAMLSTGGSGLLNLVAISPNVLSLDPAWPANYRITGYWFHDEPDFSPDETLSDFLRDGEAPVVITFGSVAGVNGPAMTRAVVAAVSSAGCRAILQAGSENLGGERLPAGMIRIGYVPHGWLFARARWVVTHGGAGTTAAAFRAGVPPITVYHYGDQRFWGLQAARLGVAPRPLSRASFGASSLADRIRTASHDGAMRAKAGALGERIRAEDGVANAVTLIEQAMAH